MIPLRLPSVREPGTQLALWDWVGNVQFVHWAQTRHATGDYCEEAACKLFGGERMTTDGRAHICPDIKLGERDFLEVKSVGEKRQGIVYEHILDRGLRFIRRNQARLRYVFWIHETSPKDELDLFALRRSMAAHTARVIVVPFQAMLTAVGKLKITTMNYRSRSASGRPDVPMTGWRIPRTQLQAWASGQASFAPDLNVYGCPTGGFPVYHVPRS